MDQSIRNKLRNVVTQCRKLLEEAVRQVLQGQFGISESGKKDEVHVEDESSLKLTAEDQGCRRDLVAHLGHIEALGYKAKDSLAQLVREIAFTHLNRLCAYKMMEAREVWVGGQRFRESVSRGMKSQGFQFYLADHADDKKLFDTGHQDVAYRHFLGWLGALLSEEIGVLFSPTDPANRLFPPQRVLDDVLGLLNSDDLKDIWAEDETIGWVYQYFTPKELRDQVRKESAAPRNSYELAFRNQFFTPRYVVEFLTDNTLGRIWYEMRKGDTKLKDQCGYMVRRLSDVFLAEGQSPPEPTQNQVDLSQEELFKQPVHIPHRPKKDPRELRILDPACGSGHFLLYCFQLLLLIYEEAYADPDLGPTLKKDYPTLDALRRDVPRLILAHNLHGIDIDKRATQIAALALWLRCQRAYREMGLKQDRPKITKSNIVCAEPMPGERTLLDEFLKTLKQDRLEDLIGRVMQVPEGSRVRATESMVESLNELVRLVWDKMQLAGEAGSLLKIEEELQEAVRTGQEEWEEKLPLFRFTEFSLTEKPKESYVQYVPGEGVSFWQRAEALVLEALREYARHTANGGRLQKQLFADDAEQGFAFVDICQKRFDVVLMNPPFGEGSKPAKGLIDKQYPRSKNDLYAAFVEQGINRLNHSGMLGAITSRTGLFLSSFQKWRECCLLNDAKPIVFADLGYGVLDSAMVETAAYCLNKGNQCDTGDFFRLLHSEDKVNDLRSAVNTTKVGRESNGVYRINPVKFKRIPGSPFAYWISPRIQKVFEEYPPFESNGREVRVGGQTSNDFQFLRLHWEHGWTTTDCEWRPFAKGGSFSPYYSEINLVVNWDQSRQTFRGFFGRIGRLNHHPSSYEYYFRPGLTFGRRIRRFSPACLPRGCVFSDSSNAIFLDGDAPELLWSHLAYLNGLVVHNLVSISAPLGKMEVGYLQRLPFGRADSAALPDHDIAVRLAKVIAGIRQEMASANETSRIFTVPALFRCNEGSLSESLKKWKERLIDAGLQITEAQHFIDNLARDSYQIDVNDAIATEEGPKHSEDAQIDSDVEEDGGLDEAIVSPHTYEFASDLVSYAIGSLLGRWDLRLVTCEKLIPTLPDPFNPLPVCQPGLLGGQDAQPSGVEQKGYPLRITSDGIIPDAPDHPDDIVRRVREVLELIWKDRGEAIEQEACEILGVKELREYFRKPGKGGFWDDHVSRYSKSRRKAPIYWLLQTSKKNYGLWLYYHRLDKDILFKARQNYVEPKIRLEQTRLDSLRSQKSALGTAAKGAKKIDKDIERQETLLVELKDFAEKLERAAKLNFGNPEKLNSEVVYDPDLNDGVVLSIAPLWELVPWKEAKNYWEELLEGKYEWSSMGKLLRKKGLVK